MKHLLLAIVLTILCQPIFGADKPNILWLTSEDHGPEMGCYGDKVARTPNVDALAAKGMIFKKAWSVAPVCAPARTAIITGMYPSSTGGLHMRSMVSMPEGTQMYPKFLQKVGYYCSNNSKTDYNVRDSGQIWDESSGQAHWKKRAEGQPFFAVFNSTKSHESQIRTRPHSQITQPADIRIPAYHPDTPEVREDWAQYYDKVSAADADAGKHLKDLADAGLTEDTIIFYYGDHGSGMPRSKRWPSNSGLHVPMVVYFPAKWQHLAPKEYSAGGSSDRMVSFVDLAPTLLSIVGIQPPACMQGHAFAGPYQTEPQPYLYGERGRMDERMDLVRSITDGRYVYLRNYYPHVSQAQRVDFQFQTPTTRIWNQLFTEGKTTPPQSIFWTVPKEPEELYDLQSDRDEVKNLAHSPEHRPILEKLRAAQRAHLAKVRDVCFLPESEVHSRAEGSTPYDIAHDDTKYPFERILAAADLASGLDSTAVPQLTKLMTDADSAIRFWGTLGILMRGEDATRQTASALDKALSDDSVNVRIAAAQALGTFGDEAALNKALATLSTLATPEANGVLTSMAALAAIEALGPKAASLHPAIASMKADGPSPDGRYGSYVPRLIQNIAPDAKPAAGKAKRKGKKKTEE
ncbi:putative sulfatase [Prosthecobacter fusiformis]|uniref:Putative sulfatase n=1 Tax=Prosthecobacter fusiformis TaxID=48464 RepID=A0A4R7SP04_9BACT|nr:sulfatase-like hydrolase/transferase [Prosthecobacter fusiformis]TDU80930.1 putative sulfatase [Prosthecobacter fusiformis]